MKVKKDNIISALLILIGIFCQIMPIIPDILNYAIILILLIMFLILRKLDIENELSIKSTYAIKWYGLFGLYAIMTSIYTINTINPEYAIIRIIICFVTAFFVTQYIDYEKNFTKLLDGFIIGGFIGILYVFSQQYFLIGTSRLGSSIYGSSVQFGNVIIITLYSLLWKYKNQSKKSIILIISIIFAFFFALASGTRKALLLPILFYLIATYIDPSEKKSKKLLFFLVIAVLLVVFCYYSIHNAFLYSIIGKRIESLATTIFYNEESDGSAIARMNFKKLAFQMFLNKPIFGYGIHGFAYMNYYTYGKLVYAHDNILDILSCLGIVGFILFYRIYYIVFSNLKKILKYITYNNVALFLLVFTIVTFIMEPFTMSHLSQASIVLLSCAGEMVYYIKRKDVAHEHKMSKNNI